MAVDLKSLQQKNSDLLKLYGEKSRKHQQTQHLYETLKKRYMINNVQTAASEHVNQTLQAINSQSRPETYSGMPDMTVHGPSDGDSYRPHMLQSANGVEKLHTHQRSGSSNHGSEIGAMPPPQLHMRASQRSRRLLSTAVQFSY